MAAAASTVRAIVQQCLSAKLQVQPASQEQDAQWVEVGRGIVIYVCFLKGSRLEHIPKVARSILNVKLSESPDDDKGNVSVLDLPGDILIVPQATLGGKMKGKNVQYHSNIAKEEGMQLYEEFISQCQVFDSLLAAIAVATQGVATTKLSARRLESFKIIQQAAEGSKVW